MTTQQIGFFLKLAEELNFTKVARMFYITQPTLSKQITILESELAVKLFSRDRNSVKLTSAGKCFYERIKPVFQELMDAVRDVQSCESDWGTIRIGIHEEQLMSNSLTLAISDLRSIHPELNISIHGENLDELIEGIEAGQYDVINVIGNLLPEHYFAKDSRYAFLPLERESYYLAFSRHLIELPEEITKEALAEVLSKYDLPFPVLLHMESVASAKALLLRNMSDMELSKANMNVVLSGRPISLPTQVSSRLGVTLSNLSSVFSINPEIRLAKIMDTENGYEKGLLWKKQNGNQYVGILLDCITRQLENI